jgi:hypothetical protein
MRLALVGAVALVLACQSAVAGPTGAVPLFPAGLPRADNPMEVVPQDIPALTPTQYRGTYVSGAPRGAGAGGNRPPRAGAGGRWLRVVAAGAPLWPVCMQPSTNPPLTPQP